MASPSITSAPEISPVHDTYIPAASTLREFTPRALVVGTLLGMIFGASSLYLVLKVGLTVSASIPVAVISIALFRSWSKFGGRDATILENNIVQTAGSAGESIAFGVGVTMPAILILGFDLELARVALVAVLGALLGILMMIPLRRALIVHEHGTLKYPEGTACAEVLKAGASQESRLAASASAKAELKSAEATGSGQDLGAKMIFGGFALGVVYNTVMKVFRMWKDTPEKVFGPPFKSGSVGIEITPELLGVGYIIGPRIASIMAAGGVLSYLVLIPLIKFFGEGMNAPLAPGKVPISTMSPGQIRYDYILYIGAGAVTAGGIISLLRSLPTILHGLRAGLADFSRKPANGGTKSGPRSDETGHGPIRTDRDLSMKTVAISILLLVTAIWFAPPLHMNLLGAALIVVFGFIFVTVSSRLTGQIGSSSNPISGMTIATLLFTCLIFLLIGWTGGGYYVTALSVGAVVCVASSNGGSTSQDLKTGYLIGATPRFQQIAILIGALVSALALGPVLLVLNQKATVYVPAAEVLSATQIDEAELSKSERLIGPQALQDTNSYRVWHKTELAGGPAGKYLVDTTGRPVWYIDPGINGVHTKRPDGSEVRKFDAPKATLVSYIIRGILDRKLPWALVLFGVMIAVTLELCGVSSLAFAVGVYLPLSASAPIFVGGLVRWLVDFHQRRELAHRNLDAAQLSAESDKSPGVLMASGYIAGGAIAGIIIAILAGMLEPVDRFFGDWAKAHNPFFEGAHADALSLLPFAIICIVLYLTGRGRLFAGKAAQNH